MDRRNKNANFRIHKWLAGIVIFLLAPSLLFAGLWVKTKLNSVEAYDLSLAGLAVLEEIGPQIEARALGFELMPVETEFDRNGQLPLDAEAREILNEEYRRFLNEQSIKDAALVARKLARATLFAAKIDSATTHETEELPGLIADTLLTVILESSRMVHAGMTLKAKEEINLWDKIAVPVQGGQFKAAADQAASISRSEFARLPAHRSADLIALGTGFRASNMDYQKAGATLLTSIIKADTGSQIDAKGAREAYPQLAKAAMDLWFGVIDYLKRDLINRRDANVLAVVSTTTGGVLVILLALAMALFLSRTLAHRTQAEIENIGYHDPLTGLPNRRALLKLMENIRSEGADSNGGYIGVFLIDIRHFKAINNRYGEQFGDEVLRTVSMHLNRLCGCNDVVTRTGGTEFVLVNHEASEAKLFEALAEDLIKSFGPEQAIRDKLIKVEISIGISSCRCQDLEPHQLLLDADLALRSAKSEQSMGYAVFDAGMRNAFEHQDDMARDLVAAMADGHILPWFQPQVCAISGEIIGAEALVRWVDPVNGLRHPGSFLPVAAQAGYMEKLDRMVRIHALQAAARAQARTGKPFHIGLNMSAGLLANPACVELLLQEVSGAGLTPKQVSVEILETVMIDEYTAEPIRANVARLAELGFLIELDDFGTGHASLSSLRDLKVNRVKIDRSFVSGVDQDPELQKYTLALIQLAGSLGIGTLAEGVETKGERDWLAQNGCQFIQGYLISKAIPESDLIRSLENGIPQARSEQSAA